jgi:hypothetical protein
MSHHHERFIDLAAIEAYNSTVLQRTGAVLVKGSKVHGKAASDWDRQTFGGQVIAMTGHAEVMAILSSSLRARRVLPSLLSIYGSPRQGWEGRGKQGKERKATSSWIHNLCYSNYCY